MPASATEAAIIEAHIDAILAQVKAEALRAAIKHKPMNSPHEGYAVLLEEVDELWDHVKADTGRSREAHVESIQIAAMGVRYCLDVCRF